MTIQETTDQPMIHKIEREAIAFAKKLLDMFKT